MLRGTLKHQNKRDAYIQNWWDAVNWDAVTERLGISRNLIEGHVPPYDRRTVQAPITLRQGTGHGPNVAWFKDPTGNILRSLRSRWL
ncbi:MAG: hypothetical protein IPO87_16680 [Flavobacteriales bacterium]|nr:hypothetical protein [Flavobacteriales bacterium]